PEPRHRVSRGESRERGSGQPRPAFGLVPWLAFLRRALVLRLLVFFDIGEATLGRGVTPVQTARALASVGPDAGPSERRFNRAGSPNRCGEMGRPWLRAAGASGSRRGAHSEHRAPAPIGSSECT